MFPPSPKMAACSGMARFNRRQAIALSGTLAGSLATAPRALVGASWLTLLAERMAQAADSNERAARPKSLIMVWLQGGPSQLETFDPHPGTRIGGDTRSIDTSLPGLRIASSLPAVAEQMHLATLIRSVISKEGDHERATYHLKTGWRPDPTVTHPALGALLCHQSPSNLEIPRHISILPGQWPARGGFLGPAYDAFQLRDPDRPIPNLSSRVDAGRQQTRLAPLLSTLEEEFRRGRLVNLDRERTQHEYATARAVAMMGSEQLDAFDTQREPADVRRAFGDTPFGRGCLAAVRLIERGVRCVEIELNGWDTHINNHDLQMAQAQRLDAPLAGLLRELEQRGLLNDTVVFCGGEFGRTPKLNAAGGRDHWPHGFSVLVAGGRFRRGLVHGATNPHLAADEPEPQRQISEPLTVPELHATLLAALDIPPAREWLTPIGRPLRLADAPALPSLLD
jgi:hypothetical protein